jgi:hypothetical protein
VRLAFEILTLALGAVGMLVVLPGGHVRRRVTARTPEPPGPEDLDRLERLVVTGRSSAGAVHVRLRPLLAEIAVARLARRGVRLDRSPDQSRALLGDELWNIVRPDRPRPADMRGPGISLDELAEMTDRLERL